MKMKAFTTKPMHPIVESHYHNIIFSKKIKNFNFEVYFNLSEEAF